MSRQGVRGAVTQCSELRRGASEARSVSVVPRLPTGFYPGAVAAQNSKKKVQALWEAAASKGSPPFSGVEPD